MRKRSVPVLLPTFLVLGALGAWAGTSMAQLPPTPPPPVTLPTVTVPPLPLPPPPQPPTVTTPPVTVPSTPKPPVDAPKPPVPLPVTVPRTSVPGTLPPAGQPSTSAPAGGPPASARRQFGASSRIATIKRVRVSRPWVNARGSLAEREVRITFWLSRPGTVVFFVDELAPECRYVGKFLVRGRSGRNEVHFRGLVGGRTLDAGTYRLTARPRGNRARRLTGVTIVMLEHPPGPAEIAAARARNTCPGGVPPSALAAEPASAAERDDTTGGVAGVQATRQPFVDESPGPLGAAVETIQTAAEAIPPVLFALAALAILLLALAALPQPVRASRAGAALVHHRGTLALAGFGVLIAAVLSLALLT